MSDVNETIRVLTSAVGAMIITFASFVAIANAVDINVQAQVVAVRTSA